MAPDVRVEVNHEDYTVLVVDDILSNVLLLKVLLGNEKYKVITASDGPQALDQVAENHPDLILLDVMMPGMNGFEVAERLKTKEDSKNIPIIFLTALNTAVDVVRGFKVGADDFISKPFNKEELVIRVNHQISLVAAKRIILEQAEDLRKTIKGRDKMYSVIGHDLRSPISSIKMVLNLLSTTVSPEQMGQDFYDMLKMANQSAEDVYALLDNLLKWAKSQTGRVNFTPQDFDVVECVNDVVTSFTLSAGLKDIRIDFPPTQPIPVFADMDMVKTVTRNLLSNALKFSYGGSSIEVSVEVKHGMARVSVADHGKGISEEGQKKLLNAETHFTNSGTNNEEGSGLGLLLCLDFTQRNGGKLWFDSEEGKGSTFFFTVPLQKPIQE